MLQLAPWPAGSPNGAKAAACSCERTPLFGSGKIPSGHLNFQQALDLRQIQPAESHQKKLRELLANFNDIGPKNDEIN